MRGVDGSEHSPVITAERELEVMDGIPLYPAASKRGQKMAATHEMRLPLGMVLQPCQAPLPG